MLSGGSPLQPSPHIERAGSSPYPEANKLSGLRAVFQEFALDFLLQGSRFREISDRWSLIVEARSAQQQHVDVLSGFDVNMKMARFNK